MAGLLGLPTDGRMDEKLDALHPQLRGHHQINHTPRDVMAAALSISKTPVELMRNFQTGLLHISVDAAVHREKHKQMLQDHATKGTKATHPAKKTTKGASYGKKESRRPRSG